MAICRIDHRLWIEELFIFVNLIELQGLILSQEFFICKIWVLGDFTWILYAFSNLLKTFLEMGRGSGMQILSLEGRTL